MSSPSTPASLRSRASTPSRVASGVFLALALGLRLSRFGSLTVALAVASAVVLVLLLVVALVVRQARRRLREARLRHPGAAAVTSATLRFPATSRRRRRSAYRVLPITVALLPDRLLLEAAPPGAGPSYDVPLDGLTGAYWATDRSGSRRTAALGLSRAYGSGPDLLVRLDPLGVARETRAFALAVRDTLPRWLPGDQPGPPPAALTSRRAGALSLTAALVAMLVAIAVGYGGGQLLQADTSPFALRDQAVGVPGYYTADGPEGKPIAPGAPWGVACEPIVVEADASVPDADYDVLSQVVAEARTRGVDIALAGRDGTYDLATLYAPAGRPLMPHGVDVSAGRGSAVGAAHENLHYSATPTPDGSHEYLAYVRQVLNLDTVGTDPGAMRKAALRLVGVSQGVWDSTAAGSAFGSDFDRAADDFSAGDVRAMLTMSGCAPYASSASRVRG